MRQFLILLGCLLAGYVQADSFNFARIDNTDGLSNNQVECIFKDSRGFIWFGTNYGLNRYDGYRMETFVSQKNDTNSLLYNAVPDILEDYKGNLWLGGNPFYYVFDVRAERFHQDITNIMAEMGFDFIPTLVDIDKHGDYYFYNPEDGIHFYKVKDGRRLHYKQSADLNNLSPGTISHFKAVDGFIWVLFESGLLERFNEKTGTVDFRNHYLKDHYEASIIVKHLFIDKQGCPWVYPGIKDDGVLQYDFDRAGWVCFGTRQESLPDIPFHPLSSSFVREVAQDQTGRIWIATDHGGITLYDKANEQTTVLRHDPVNPHSVSQNSVISLFCDDDGIMWAGTFKNGVSYYHPGMLKFNKSPLFFFQHPDLETKDCNSLLEDRQGNLWIGTNGNGLLKQDKQTGRFSLYRHHKNDPASLSSDIVISLLEDKKGRLWAGTFMGGLNRMDGQRFTSFQSNPANPNSLSNNSIYSLVQDPDGAIWIATLGGGIDRLDPEKQQFLRHDIGNMPEMSSNYVLSMSVKAFPHVLLSTSQGLNLLNTKTNTITAFFKDQQLIDQLSDIIMIYSLMDSQGNVWMGTESGINLYLADLKTMMHLTKADGMPSNQVVSLVEDNRGNIWAGTRNGLACITMTRDTKSGQPTFSIVSFDEKDGLVSTIFNQNAVYKNKEGWLYFGCTKGYTCFDPDRIRFNATAPRPGFTALYVGNERVEPGQLWHGRILLEHTLPFVDKVELKHNENNVTVLFSAFSFIHPEKNRYRYRLIGLSEEWQETRNGDAFVTLNNLSRGTYTLEVMASNNDNVWAANPIQLKLVVKPPFWLTWWAVTFYIMLGALLAGYTIHYMLRKQRREFEQVRRISEARQQHEMDEMKFRFFTNISHEFRTPLTLILNPVEKLLLDERDEAERTLLNIIQRNANALLNLVNQLLDFRKLDAKRDQLNTSVGDIVSFIKDCCYAFTDLATSKSVNFAFTTSISELRMDFDQEKISKVMTNLLSNAFKYTPDKGRIEVALDVHYPLNSEDKTLSIRVTDTGVGIPERDLSHIFERFYRVDNQDNTHQTGTGVGLHIVSEYVKMHHGEVVVESKEGQGSVFTIWLPVKYQVQQEIIAINGEETPENQVPPEEAGLKDDHLNKLPLMLVVDDNDDFREFMASLFSNTYRVLKAQDGDRAYKIILDKMPDLIICDVMMPNMDGFELCRLVKQDVRISHIPIILLTAKAGQDNAYKGIEAGAEDYIAKPFNMDMLTLKVARIMERQRHIREHFRKKVDVVPGEVEITTLDEKFVKKAVGLVEANLSNPGFLVEDLCREMGMSRVYFYKKILSLTDKTPSEFIRFIRLRRAADLLEKSQLFVNEVAFQVGFNDPKYFRKYFKDEFGLSPNEYKKKFMV